MVVAAEGTQVRLGNVNSVSETDVAWVMVQFNDSHSLKKVRQVLSETTKFAKLLSLGTTVSVGATLKVIIELQ